MPLKDFTSGDIQCQGREARITNRTQSRSASRKRAPSSHKSKNNEVNFKDKNLPRQESPRCTCRISNTGHAYSCPDVIFPYGFTRDECEILATRQRATNYLFYLYTDIGQPVRSAEQRTKSSHSSPMGGTTFGGQTAVKVGSPFGRTDRSVLLNKRVSSSVLSSRKENGNRVTAPRRESLVQEIEASIDDSPATIIIRSLNRDLSPSARLERYLISLQRAGFLTSARKERRQNVSVELARGITQKGEVSLRSKFLPHPPMYLFDKAVKDSPFKNKSR